MEEFVIIVPMFVTSDISNIINISLYGLAIAGWFKPCQ